MRRCYRRRSGQSIQEPRTRYLSVAGLETPSVVIANAQREVLRIVDLIKDMLQAFADALGSDDRKKLRR